MERALQVAINAQLVSFGETYRNAGVSRYIFQMLDGLRRQDADQHYTAFINGKELEAARASAIGHSPRVTLAPTSGDTTSPLRRIAWEQTRLPTALRQLGTDVFHAPVNVLPRRTPCATVVTVHDLAFMRYPQYFRPTRRLYQRTQTRRSVRAATRVVAVSEHTRSDLIEMFGAAPEKIAVIYPSISPDFRPITDRDARRRFRAKHGLPERYILFLGTLEPRKNLETLVSAYARLRALDGEATPPLLLAGGKGWYYEPLFAKVRELGLERHVTFVGYVSREEQPLWYSSADLFVYPSYYEGFGMPIVEALACGAPTICSNAASMPEAAGNLARQVSPVDEEGIALAMQEALGDQALRARTLVEGPAWAERFSLERLARRYVDVYAQAAEARPGVVGLRRERR